MAQRIPAPVIAVLSNIIPVAETHDSMNSLFRSAGAPGDPPISSKTTKARDWLRRINQDSSVEPLEVLGRLIEGYMENPYVEESTETRRQEIADVLTKCKLRYVTGGRVVPAAIAVSAGSLNQLIRAHDLQSVHEEFERALASIDANPRDALSAACNILEATCKTYIEDEGLTMPAKQDLPAVWTVVRKDLGFDPSAVQDQDLQKILSGMISVVDGIGALRTHASTAHATGRRQYRVEARHARLAVHAAHTVTAFVLESWERKRAQRSITAPGSISSAQT